MNAQTLVTLFAGSALAAEAAFAAPILEYRFNGSGTSVANSGTGADGTLTFLNSSAVPTDLHGAPGSGLSGQSWDRAFDNTATVVNPSSPPGGALGGIAVNSSTGDVSQFDSWTVTGWYRRESGGAAPSGGTVLAQSPTGFDPSGSIPGLGTTGFGVRWHSADTLRTNINGTLLTGSGSGGG